MCSNKNQILPWKYEGKLLINKQTKKKQIEFKSEYQVRRRSPTSEEEFSTPENGKSGPAKQLNSVF
jgi:hypothetical protein